MPENVAVYSRDDLASAVMEAFRELRRDELVERLPVGSQSRKQRIRDLLDPIAQSYQIPTEDLAMALARAIDAPHAITPGPGPGQFRPGATV